MINEQAPMTNWSADCVELIGHWDLVIGHLMPWKVNPLSIRGDHSNGLGALPASCSWHTFSSRSR
jgi:hypothetical protein